MSFFSSFYFLFFLHRFKEKKTPSFFNQARFAPFTLKVAWSRKPLIQHCFPGAPLTHDVRNPTSIPILHLEPFPKGAPRCMLGPLTRGPQCCMSILRNGNVPCHYFCNFPVDPKIVLCYLSNLGNVNVMSVIFFSRVNKLHIACPF